MEIPIKKKEFNDLYKLLHKYDIGIQYLPNYYWSQENQALNKKLDPIILEIKEILEICDSEELNGLIQNLPFYLRSLIQRNTEEKPNFEIIALTLIMFELFKVKLPFKQIINYKPEESKVLELYPELIDKIDKYGLIQVNDEFVFNDVGIQYKDHVLFYHQFLRRGFTGKINKNFVMPFMKYFYKSRNQNTFWIAIDHQRILPKEHFQSILEFDTWYGPKFDEKDLDNPRSVGLTVLKRNENYPFDFDQTLDRTEFLWSYKNGVKSLQIEEVINKHISYGGYHLNRYIHTERDTNNQVLRHFDGAVKVYSPQSYEKRFEVQFSHEVKGDKKVKLFRIDGDIELSVWIDLISYFFKGNEMIIEYFDPEMYEERYGEAIKKMKDIKTAQNKA